MTAVWGDAWLRNIHIIRDHVIWIQHSKSVIHSELVVTFVIDAGRVRTFRNVLRLCFAAQNRTKLDNFC